MKKITGFIKKAGLFIPLLLSIVAIAQSSSTGEALPCLTPINRLIYGRAHIDSVNGAKRLSPAKNTMITFREEIKHLLQKEKDASQPVPFIAFKKKVYVHGRKTGFGIILLWQRI